MGPRTRSRSVSRSAPAITTTRTRNSVSSSASADACLYRSRLLARSTSTAAATAIKQQHDLRDGRVVCDGERVAARSGSSWSNRPTAQLTPRPVRRHNRATKSTDEEDGGLAGNLQVPVENRAVIAQMTDGTSTAATRRSPGARRRPSAPKAALGFLMGLYVRRSSRSSARSPRRFPSSKISPSATGATYRSPALAVAPSHGRSPATLLVAVITGLPCNGGCRGWSAPGTCSICGAET